LYMPLTVSCFSKIQIGFTFLVPAHPGSPTERAVKHVCKLHPIEILRPLYRSTCISRHHWRILLVQSFTARMPLLTATSAFGFGGEHAGVHLNSVICIVSIPTQLHLLQNTKRKSRKQQCNTCKNVYIDTHTHPFNGPLSRTTQASRYQKGTTNLDFTEARDSEWQWHQLGHMQACTLLQTDNHASTPPLSIYRPNALPAAKPTASEH